MVNQQKIDKDKVQKGFVKSITTYRKHAIVQEAIASRLIAEMRWRCPEHHNSVLEIGCGPAVLTDKFFQFFDANKYLANDIVEEYAPILEALNPKIQFMGGDIEAKALPQNLDLILSGSTFQWFHNLDAFLEKCAKALSPTGFLAFSSFGPENYREIRSVNGTGLDYLTYNAHLRLLDKYFDVVWSEKEIITRHFPEPIGVLHHMKQTGVNGLPGKVWTKSDLKNFEERYKDLYGTELGVPLSYQPIYFIAKPKSIND
ncbi:malonyl-[acyl-carrier protein] O-methyltransferase BioC [Ancylomarina euxinus]|uniref:Malonyl-[acyl-carrier protein] O-methyltransferase n=1 Tax=Ancylomarina euxinus TaxID=2283627 RepID=A0A425Y3M7_9BACT|nr:malonyl-ACP O-methyltransferase BioC [Ancylomarina euxinus]RRG22873.1 malonyl-[acyl-carrier protein] O-methyltransferase BioC [Ancylomarina euxinus]